jgi:sensor histidine kinase YesM
MKVPPAAESVPMTSPIDTAGAGRPRSARFVVRGLKSMGFGVLIAMCLAIVFNQSFWVTLVYSLCIAVACWFSIDGGRIAVARWKYRPTTDRDAQTRNDWPGWPWMAVVVVLGTMVGYSAGNALANWITGYSSPGLIDSSLRQALALLIVALIPGAGITYVFYSRERIAATQAQAQAAQRQAAENQLKLLESQLEPHMLFNTLANLRVLIGSDPPRAQAMLDRLIAFLRATLSASRVGRQPLRAEFARLNDYLELMRVRMGDRLQYRFGLPDDLADMPVPPLLLQPLVENCIKHGLEPQVGGGWIEVTALRIGNQLVLRVRDTGIGRSTREPEGTQFGLAQVRERLATLYGPQASLELAEPDDAEGGTLAIVRLPLNTA